MFIILRLTAAFVGFVIRLGVHFLVGQRFPQHSEGGIPHYESRSPRYGSKSPDQFVYELAVPFPRNVSLTITREQRWDKVFKAVGLTREFETGDGEFDSTVSIACDHPDVGTALAERESSRQAVRELIDIGFERVFCDGTSLVAKVTDWQPQDKTPYVNALSTLAKDLGEVMDASGRLFRDRLDWKLAMVEASIWAIAAYAFAAVRAWAGPDVHVQERQLVLPGLGVAAIVFAGLFAAILVFVGRSSRSHRVLVESTVVLGLSLPVFGIQTLGDANRSWDQNPSLHVRAQIHDRSPVTWIRSRYARRYPYSYLHFARVSGPVALPARIIVNERVYGASWASDVVDIELGQGRFGFPYYRAIAGVRLR